MDIMSAGRNRVNYYGDDKGAITSSEMLTFEMALRGEDEYPYD